MNEDLDTLKQEITSLKDTITDIQKSMDSLKEKLTNHRHQGYDNTQVIDLGFGSTDTLTLVSLNYGEGSPEGVLTANAGSLYVDTNGGASLTLYVKESGTSNTGWIAK